MRLASISRNGKAIVAVRRNADYVDLSIAAPALPTNMNGICGAIASHRSEIEAASKGASGNAVFPASGATYLPLVPNPGKTICIGLNYTDHAAEGGNPVPDYPAIFLRGATSLEAHGAALLRPKCSDKFDYEAELAVVVGKPAKNVSKDKALDYVAGYSVFNEGSVRDYQRKSTQWTMGKNFDRTGGFGPELVTSDELPAGASGLKIMTRINGQTLQNGNTGNMIFSVATIISVLSEGMTLEPGDVIVTGTPAGVGYPRKPPVFMKPGDMVEIEIERIGVLVNGIEDEK
jgi:acylpyruvate hydrolase